MKKFLFLLGLLIFVSAFGEEAFPVLRELTDDDYDAGFALTKIGTDERFDFSVPSGAVTQEEWWKSGAASDWFRLESISGVEGPWSFVLGLDTVAALSVFSHGTMRPAVTDPTTFISSFDTTLGIVPVANHGLLPEDVQPSCLWWTITASNSLIVTWLNVLVDRSIAKPVSFQVEVLDSGSVIFRYDLSRLPESELDGLTVGMMNGGKGRRFSRFARNITSLKWTRLDPKTKGIPDPDKDGITTSDELMIYGTNPYCADSDDDGLSDYEEVFTMKSDPLCRYSMNGLVVDRYGVMMAGCDPRDCPDGSDYSYIEHAYYSGSVDAKVTVPRSTHDIAVLEVFAYGEGAGELLVGDQVVPVFPGMPRLKVAVPRCSRQALTLRDGDGLCVCVDSEDFCIGELDGGFSESWIEFPNVEATHPCIHTRDGNTAMVELDPGADFDELTCEWESQEGVSVCYTSQRTAVITAEFPRNTTALIGYRLWHPQYLFGCTTYGQTCEYCPKIEDDGEYLATANYSDYRCVPRCWCWCSYWYGYQYNGCWCPCHSDEDVEPNEEEPDWCSVHDCPRTACEELHEDEYDNVANLPLRLEDVLKYHRPLRATDYRWIDVTVPAGSYHCCECPDHWTNYVSIASKSRHVAVMLGEEPFWKTVEDCRLEVSALSPSEDFADATVTLCRTGVIYEVHDYTVFGVGIDWNEGTLTKLNDIDKDFGLPVVIETNLERAVTLKLQTDVLLPSGNIRLAFEKATADMQLWVRVRDEGTSGDRYTLLIDSMKKPKLDLSLSAWRKLTAYSTYENVIDVLLTTGSEGRAELVYGYAAEYDGKGLSDVARQAITVIPPPLYPDFNRDGKINGADAVMAAKGRFRFWTNDDIWNGDNGLSESFYKKLTGNDRGHNGEDEKVNGRNDLVNLLPLAMDVRSFLEHWDGHKVEVTVRDNGGCLRRCYSDGTWNDVRFGVLTDAIADNESEGGTCPLREAKLKMFQWGEVIDEGKVRRCLDGRGMMMIESTMDCYDPITVSVTVDGETVLWYTPKLQFSMIDDMYRWHDIRGVADGTQDASWTPEIPDEPSGRPDAECDDSDFYFVHGYNVSLLEARQWGRAMFKRMWWAGLNSRFHVVTWFGNDSQIWVPLIVGLASPDYHVNVEHAFASASALATIVNRGSGRNYIAAHSLGNMLVSAAIQDHALKYERYFMLNAAVAGEAYDTRSVTDMTINGMTPVSWIGINRRYCASRWFEYPRLSDGDARQGLTWRNRFKDVKRVVNYYSSEEEVLQCDDTGAEKFHIQRDWAWYNQERLKGVMLPGTGRNEGGWGFNQRYKRIVVHSLEYGLETEYLDPYPADVNAIADNLLEHPVFLPFENTSLLTANTVTEITESLRAQLLADAIPAESYPAGFSEVPVFSNEPHEENVNMATKFKTNVESVYSSTSDARWGHSFFIGAPFMVVHGLYEHMNKSIIGGTK